MRPDIDPDRLTADDVGEKQATLEMAHAEAIEHVRSAFTDAGFGVPVEFSPSELLAEKIGADRDPYYVLGACHPRMADRALDETLGIGGLFPCNVVVWEEAPGVQRVYHVSIMKIARLVGIAETDDAWGEIVADTSALVDEAWGNLDATEDVT